MTFRYFILIRQSGNALLYPSATWRVSDRRRDAERQDCAHALKLWVGGFKLPRSQRLAAVDHAQRRRNKSNKINNLPDRMFHIQLPNMIHWAGSALLRAGLDVWLDSHYNIDELKCVFVEGTDSLLWWWRDSCVWRGCCCVSFCGSRLHRIPHLKEVRPPHPQPRRRLDISVYWHREKFD